MDNPNVHSVPESDQNAVCESRVIILGASGRTGSQLVKAALEEGYAVTACARYPEKISAQHPRLTKVSLDMHDTESIARVLATVKGVVISTLGIFHKTDATPLADITENLVQAMQKTGLRRLILMSSLGVGDSKGQGNWVVAMVSRFILPYVLKDKEKQEELVRASGMDWTVLRPPQLVGSDVSKPYIRWSGTPPKHSIKWKISTRDTADALLALAKDPGTIGNAYQISY
ncbi:NAD(P)-dependent oxidoreductase [uncultured Microbulbifer sp.]|uniref:NAD(P)-dependent oxidoreductase n=1 Tax=uncultured Microbulbifer sp. TaxID=348147 RepID=UPI00260C4A01|nr:NAD(P)-binding oxidoreductase [uncultured Microbulbifer sp.]